jgi:PKD repeat protein
MKFKFYSGGSLFLSLSILIILAFSNPGFGTEIPKIKFKTGQRTLPENVREFVKQPNIQSADLFDGFYFKIIQFYQIPTDARKAELQRAGIHLKSYLPDLAYQAAIAVNADLTVLESAGVRSVVDFTPAWKLNHQLFRGEQPDWSLNEKGYIDLVVRYYKGINADRVLENLSSQGFGILRRYDYSSWVEVRVPQFAVMQIAQLPFVNGVEPIAPPSTPDDEPARTLHRSNAINTDAPMGRHYDGTGVAAALADDGPVGPHIDYQGRIDQSNTTTNTGSHGDMTAGILMGAGNLNPRYRGMGTGTFIYIYDISGYNHILNSPVTNQTLGVMVTSTSYSQGCNDYTTDTQTGDQILNQNPTLMHVYSAGNNGTGNCQYGAGAGWGNITGGYKQGKNVMACGNLNYLDALENSSSRGPAEDGRIKPDICANGINQMSTNGNNTYQVGGGTSAACPGIAGIVSQLHDAFRQLNGGLDAEGALLKACLLNTAEDLGNPGPDFRFGWGRVNALRAVRTLEDVRYYTDVISQGGSMTHTLNVPAGTAQLRVMLYWNDVEGDPLASKALVNDLNFLVTDPTSTTFEPWVLNPAPNATTLNAPAVRGVDDLNNMEQVTIDNPVAGSYNLDVSGFLVPNGPQKYYIVYELVNDEVEITYPIGHEGFVPNETETIRWDAYGNNGTFDLEYSVDNGSNWTSIAGNIAATQRYYNWVVPSALTGQALIRVNRGAQSSQSPEPFSIIGLPSNITVAWCCPDSIRLTWNPVVGAIGYEVSMLGAMYMDSVAYSTTNAAVITGTIPSQGYWFSVRAYTPDNTKGRRANAIYKAPGVFACPVNIDVAVNNISPGGTLQNCQNLTATNVKVVLENKGLTPVVDIPVHYSVNNGPVVSETVTGTLNPGATVNYTFTASYNFSPIGSYNLRVWTTYTGDGNIYNDTVANSLTVINGTVYTVPYSENFETFTNCATSSNCGQTNCTLTNGWVNLPNNVSDQIDWRTNNGTTPSANTGPTIDHNPGTAAGKYIYLEASACFQQEGIAISPCFDLAGTFNPRFDFWFHMWGTTMGQLNVDVFVNDQWQNNVIPVISGNQGNAWQMASVDLTPFAGQMINIRFRGVTGSDYMSDIVIDDINLFDMAAPPITNFTASSTNLCEGEIITLIDLSQNTPTSWDWVITPASGWAYVNGTNANSQNPQVQFNTIGVYDVALTSTNAFGSSNVTINSYITVGSGAIIPLIETFPAGTFPPSGWQVENGDGLTTWVLSGTVTGPAGTATNAAYMNNFSYNATGQEDGMMTESVDLTTSLNPIMTFDVAYAGYSSTRQDALRIDISNDCGVTYFPTGYYKLGPALATVANMTTLFTPNSINQWRKDTVDLLAYAGLKIKIKFVNENGRGNSMYIDNVNFKESPVGLLEIESGLLINAYPNPSNGNFQIAVNSDANRNLKFEVVDVKGSVIKELSHTFTPGTTHLPLNLNGVNAGVYFLRVNTDSQTRMIKLVVM